MSRVNEKARYSMMVVLMAMAVWMNLALPYAQASIISKPFLKEPTKEDFFAELKKIHLEQTFPPENFGLKRLIRNSKADPSVSYFNVIDIRGNGEDAHQCSEIASTLFKRFDDLDYRVEYWFGHDQGGLWGYHYYLQVYVGGEAFTVDFSPPFHKFMNQENIRDLKHVGVYSKAPRLDNLCENEAMPLTEQWMPYEFIDKSANKNTSSPLIWLILIEASEDTVIFAFMDKKIGFKDLNPYDKNDSVIYRFTFSRGALNYYFGQLSQQNTSTNIADKDLVDALESVRSLNHAVFHQYDAALENQQTEKQTYIPPVEDIDVIPDYILNAAGRFAFFMAKNYGQ
ncbi:MAG: hypothetical protein KDK51_02955 [Deltaproteobacteria bacterium]|nr:hypothetical protein [Deltaproteobacteria bacterium]